MVQPALGFQVSDLPESLTQKIHVDVFQEKDGSWAAACSALGVYSVGKTKKHLEKNFKEALDLHLSVIRRKAIDAVHSTA